ncbi:hypothetical protein QJS10_CPB17g00497 [Acorus calamus]|uniref:Uncharacterized protein n=1 Tax=Acorus calamus TaxID=4465 RepID=A0AAV9CR37_ACOCL|nr:hypothetical protein QJS10_CPB17g00497 [Acorus calamus]
MDGIERNLQIVSCEGLLYFGRFQVCNPSTGELQAGDCDVCRCWGIRFWVFKRINRRTLRGHRAQMGDAGCAEWKIVLSEKCPQESWQLRPPPPPPSMTADDPPLQEPKFKAHRSTDDNDIRFAGGGSNTTTTTRRR